MKEQIQAWLWSNESAASGLCLLGVNPDEAYSLSEGECDKRQDQILSSMSLEQLAAVAATIIEIENERDAED